MGIVLEGFTGIKDAIENGVNGKNFAEIVLGALIGTTGAAILGKGIAQFIVTGFGNTAVGAAIKAAGGFYCWRDYWSTIWRSSNRHTYVCNGRL